jgi:hypothetical protein
VRHFTVNPEISPPSPLPPLLMGYPNRLCFDFEVGFRTAGDGGGIVRIMDILIQGGPRGIQEKDLHNMDSIKCTLNRV